MDEHAHHGPSYTSYLTVFGVLAVLTAATVGISYSGLPEGTRHFLAFAIATVKTLFVAAVFMHLKYENRILAMFAVMPVLLAVLFILAIAPDVGTVRP